MILSTSDKIEGREMVETIGIVRGNAARARGVGYDITAGIRNLFERNDLVISSDDFRSHHYRICMLKNDGCNAGS